MSAAIEVQWIDGHREPLHRSNPAYPNGVDLDLSKGASAACSVALGYPAKRCGMYIVRCRACSASVTITTAGRADDPRSVKLGCKAQA